jgi:DNA repair exonuclease SbcCD nuclease subunit
MMSPHGKLRAGCAFLQQSAVCHSQPRPVVSTRFIHTADWQFGKPFAGVEDDQKRALLGNERVVVLERIAAEAREHQAEFVLVAGDLFDSPGATKPLVAAACSAIGTMGIPVFTIPGNHDHGGPGSVWEQEFFRRERDRLAPNFRVLLEREPLELETAVLFPCPLLRRRESVDPTAWLRLTTDLETRFGDKARIILAHGSVQEFGALPDDEESDSGATNYLDLSRLGEEAYDYIALGDWHGTRQVSSKAWYAGTPELDRFIKGEDHNPGNILAVEADRGREPVVRCLATAAIGWHELDFSFAEDSSLRLLEKKLEEMMGNRANRDLLLLHLSGSLGIDAANRLEQILESWEARLLRLKLDNRTILAPSLAETESLARRVGDPLISRVATKLMADMAEPGETGAIVRAALRELHAVCPLP